jgi:predicted PurR-regulated permease PerM
MSTSPAPPAPPDSRPAAAVRQDLARITLGVLCLLLPVGGSLWILRPFAGALVWATTLVVTTWPLMKSLEACFGHRRGPAVAVMTAAMLLLLIVPLWAAVATLVRSADEVSSLAKSLAQTGLPEPPDWVAALPLAGERVRAAWAEAAASGPEGFAAKLLPHLAEGVRWILGS